MNDSAGLSGGSGSYQFLALTHQTSGGGGIQQHPSLYQNTLQQQHTHQHRRPNYSNEDIVDDLNRCSALQLHHDYDDDEEDEEDYQMESIVHAQDSLAILDENDDDDYEAANMDVIQEGCSREESGTHRSPQRQDQAAADEEPEFEEVEDGDIETMKYLNGQQDMLASSEERPKGSREINIEDQSQSHRIDFTNEAPDQALEETHDFPQVNEAVDNESIIDNQFLDFSMQLRQQLYVACIIKQKEKKPEGKMNSISARSSSQPKSARNHSVSKTHSLQEKCHFGKQSLESESESKPKSLGFFTSQVPSGYLFKYNKNPGMTQEEAIQIMHNQENLPSFLQAFETDKQNLTVFSFDTCVNEVQNHRILTLNNEVVKFLSDSTSYRLMSFKDSIHGAMGHTSGDLSEQEFLQANDFVFIFGQHGSNKSDILNILKPESLMNRFIDTISENIRYIKVSMFYQDQEYMIAQKNIHQASLSGQKRELAMELRQAQRARMAIIKKQSSMQRKVVSEQEKMSREIRMSSHIVIQINNRIFVDLGGIECLNSLANPALVQNLTLNFGSVTNQILKLSGFYANHDFNTSDFQEQSQFNVFLKSYMSPHSRICLLCCVTSDPKLTPQTMIALDYCHKIKCYFNGVTEEDVKSRVLNEARNPGGNGLKQIRMREIGKLYEQFWAIRAGKERTGRGRNAVSPRRELNIDVLREQALIRSRLSDDPNGTMQEEKRIVTILLKEIETYIATKPQRLSVTPVKQMQHNKSQGHLRMRTTSGSRSTTSLHAPNLALNNSHLKKGSKAMNMTVNDNVSSKSKSQTRQVHKIPSVVKDIMRVRRSLSRQSKNSECSSRARTPHSYHQKYSSKNSGGSRGNPSVLIHDQRQNFCVDSSIYDDYTQNMARANDSLQADSRDTPQFQHDSLCHQFNNSSLYIRTSAASSLKFNRRRASAKRSDFNSIPTTQLGGGHQTCGAHSDLYCETSEKKSTGKKSLRRHVLSSGQKDRKQSSSRARQSLMQESIRQLEDEQENSLQLSNAAFVPGAERHTPRYMKVLNDTQLKEIMKLREQLREAEEHTERVKRTAQRKVEELRAQVMDKDKIIESLEYQVSATRKELSSVSKELADTRSERDSQAQINAQVIKQISSMKVVIEDFKEREREKEQLLIKIKQKDEKIRELQKSPRDIVDSGKINDELTRLKEENERLKSIQATVRMSEMQAIQKIESLEGKFQKMHADYKTTLEENKRLQEEFKAQEDKIKSIEKAKENYKDQALEFKSEVKQLKAQLNSRTACSTKYGDQNQQDSSSIIKDFENSQSIEEEMLFKQREKQKEAVLGDIRNLIQEYKRDRKNITTTQVRL